MFKLEDCLAYLASRNAKELAEILEKRLAVTGITRVQWMALYYIQKNAEIKQAQLATMLGVKGPTVVKLIDRMEKDNLVMRIRKDRRTNRLSLTKKGQKLFEEGLVITEQFKDDALRGIPEEHMELFKDILEQMIENTAK